MIDSFDYKEPKCSVCGGKEFYNPEKSKAEGRIPVSRILSKVDGLFEKNDYVQAGRLLEYWQAEAVALKDEFGELSITSELVGYYRKINYPERGLKAIGRAIELVEILGQENLASGGTVLLNCATAYKAFNDPQKSLELFARVEKIYLNTLTEGDERLGGLYNNMALTLVDLNYLTRAEESYKKAIAVMEKVENGKPDLAVTYVNLAHLFEKTGEREKVTDSLFTAYDLLNDDTIEKNGYYAFVCSKCAPSYEYFGFGVVAKDLTERAKEIYERA